MKQSYQGPENELTGMIIGCAIEVHRHFGCGLKETAYEAALSWELQQKGLKVERQKACPVFYKGMDLSQEDEHPRRIDLLVEGKVVVECKALPSNDYVFKAQCLTYLKMLQLRVGLVLNFGLPTMKAGIQHVINETKEEYLDRLKREHPMSIRPSWRRKRKGNGRHWIARKPISKMNSVSPIPPAPPCQRRRPASTMMTSGVCWRKRGIWSNREFTKFQTFKKEMKHDN